MTTDEITDSALGEVESLDREAAQMPAQETIARYRGLALKFARTIDETGILEAEQSPLDRAVASAKRSLRKPISALLARGMPGGLARKITDATIGQAAVKIFMRWKVVIGDKPATVVWYAVPNQKSTIDIVCGFSIGHDWPGDVVECQRHEAEKFGETVADDDISFAFNRIEQHQ